MKYYLDTAGDYYPRAVYGRDLFVYRLSTIILNRDTAIRMTPTTTLVPDTAFTLLNLPVGDALWAAVKQ
jgi:hypothetical protein